MSKYYKAEDVHKTILGMWTATFHHTTDTLIGKLESLPPIDIVHCGECRKKGTEDCNMAWWDSHWQEYVYPDDNEFCSRGTRKGQRNE